MSVDNVEQKAWKIQYLDCKYHNGTVIAETIFEVTEPNGKTFGIYIIFPMVFINDYFDGRGRDQSVKIAKENESWLKTWSLVRIEELINTHSIKDRLKIHITDLNWAKKIQQHQLKSTSYPDQKPNIFYYSAEHKIGFR